LSYRSVVDAGADGLSIITSISHAKSPKAAARALRENPPKMEWGWGETRITGLEESVKK
jgi:hypothetical protein